jgi:hypothetical protein
MTDQELIEAVGKEILGWRLVKMPPGTMWIDQQGKNREYGEPRGLGTCFDPLTNGNHILIVVNRMINQGCSITMEYIKDWYVNVAQSPKVLGIVSNASLGYAVCLAALIAVRSSRDQSGTKEN